MNVTLFGYPKTGKTTLFNLLAGAHAAVKAYDDGRREPNVRSVPLPDPRLDRIAAAYPDKRKVAAAIDLTDLVGISFGEVKASLFLGHLRKADGLLHVVRAFADPDLPPARGRLDPAADVRSMEEELVLADLVLAETRLERLDKDLKKMKDPEGEKERDLLRRLRPELESGRGLRGLPLSPAEEKLIRSFAFLSLKPLLHFINVDEKDLPSVRRPEILFPGWRPPRPARRPSRPGLLRPDRSRPGRARRGRAGLFHGRVRARGHERAALRREGGRVPRPHLVLHRRQGRGPGLDGEEEATAAEAAGAIHSDIAKGFIRAEVVAADELLATERCPRQRSRGHSPRRQGLRRPGRGRRLLPVRPMSGAFRITAQDPLSAARTGVLETPHGAVETPAFMPSPARARSRP